MKKNDPDLLSVLIIDDSELIGKRLKEILVKKESVDVLEQAKNLEEGLKIFKKNKPDVVFLDLNLSDGNGIELFPFFKRIKPSVQIIIFSNFQSTFYKTRVMEMGGDYFID